MNDKTIWRLPVVMNRTGLARSSIYHKIGLREFPEPINLGVRGILTLSFLSRIEEMLRERYGRSDLLLCDYFDLIGGTSTGAIIAASLAWRHQQRKLPVDYSA